MAEAMLVCGDSLVSQADKNYPEGDSNRALHHQYVVFCLKSEGQAPFQDFCDASLLGRTLLSFWFGLHSPSHPPVDEALTPHCLMESQPSPLPPPPPAFLTLELLFLLAVSQGSPLGFFGGG